MTKALVMIPKASRQEARAFIDANSVQFDPIVWRHGVPDSRTNDPELGIKLSADGSYPATHVLLFGDFTRAQGLALRDNITGCKVFNRTKVNVREALTRAGLRPCHSDEPQINHLLVMSPLYKIWDIADAPIDLGICVDSPKWDGYTCAIRYNNGSIVRGVTQGDGESGSDRTGRLSTIVPTTVNRLERFQVEGEVVCNTNDPADAFYALEHATRREFESLEPKFLAFNVRAAGVASWSQAMTWLNNQGFDTVINYVNDDAPKDGIVYRINDRAAENAAPIGVFALKF